MMPYARRPDSDGAPKPPLPSQLRVGRSRLSEPRSGMEIIVVASVYVMP